MSPVTVEWNLGRLAIKALQNVYAKIKEYISNSFWFFVRTPSMIHRVSSFEVLA